MHDIPQFRWDGYIYVLLKATHKQALQVELVVAMRFGVLDDEGCQVRDVVPCVALSRNVKVSAFVVREPVHPVEEEHQRILRWKTGELTIGEKLQNGPGAYEGKDTSGMF